MGYNSAHGRTRQHSLGGAFHAIIPQINADGLLSQRFDPLLPVQVRFYSYDRHRDFRSCRHNYFELFYLSSGNAVFRMGDQRLDMREGDMVLVNGLLYHNVELRKTGHDRALHGVLLYFLPDMFRGAMAARDDTEYLAPFLQQDDSFPHVIAAKTGVPEHIYALMREISTELPAQTVRSRVIVKTYLKMILVKLLKHYSAYTGPVHSFTQKHHSIERLDPHFRYLDAHYAEPLTLADAARVVGMSKSHFIHFMKRITGMSFVSYLNQFRVAKAQALMANTDKNLAEISHEVGFCDQSYFGQVFWKLLHTTPHRYRVQLEINGRRSGGTGS
jgi:AraC family transcriptional activator of pobA